MRPRCCWRRPGGLSPFDNHGAQALGGRIHRGGQSRWACAHHRDVEHLAVGDRRHEAEGFGDLQVRGVDQGNWLPAEPEHDDRQFGGFRAKLFEHLVAGLGARIIDADRNPVPREGVA